jgi:tetratricopeptide (TPR) repeat protein
MKTEHALRRKRTALQFASFLVLSLLVACKTTPPPLYEGLGQSSRAIVVSEHLAQEYFDQGLALSFGFNHDEALRSFEEVARLEGSCAMAYWGQAYALGPNINRPMTDPDRAARAFAAAQRALSMSADASALERALIEALALRFASPAPKDRGALDLAYAEAMRAVWKQYPDDALVGTLFADALMNISSDWRAWGTDEQRGAYTPEIVAVLEAVLQLAPDHAGANHFYIHAVEASDRPERGLVAADKLEGLMPAAGHMVHMPSHIYIRLGMYDQAVASNQRAVAQDDLFFAQAPRQAVYHRYRAHNHHFLVWAAMFRGSHGEAMQAARAIEQKLPSDIDDSALESYRFVPMHVMMRFGLWEEMLAEPAPAARYRVATALWHHGRAVAFANSARLKQARAEYALFEAAALTIPKDTLVRRSPSEVLLEAARQMMLGEILFQEGDREAAFAALRLGIAAEDSLPYAEPPGWMQPIRHSLGGLLLADGRAAEAEAVYLEDLERHADNVWSLHGLAECLRLQARVSEAIAVEARFAQLASHADVVINASCFCRSAQL